MKPRTTECHILLLATLAATACANSPASRSGDDTTGAGGTLDIGNPTGGGGTTGIGLAGGLVGSGDGGVTEEPQTCDEAANSHSYVGCEFWPTITANPVYVEFDPAVIVANGGTQDATVTVDGPVRFHQEVTVKAGGLQTILLKWVPDLKGPEFSLANTSGGRLAASARVDKGAYNMTSTVPVTAWQFNPLQYVKPGAPVPAIPGLTECQVGDRRCVAPSPHHRDDRQLPRLRVLVEERGTDWGSVPGGVAITATKDGTTVKVGARQEMRRGDLSHHRSRHLRRRGTRRRSQERRRLYTLTMNAGDVVELVGAWAMYPQTNNADLSGSIVNATCAGAGGVVQRHRAATRRLVANADHMEETVLPGRGHRQEVHRGASDDAQRQRRRSRRAHLRQRRRHAPHLPRRDATLAPPPPSTRARWCRSRASRPSDNVHRSCRSLHDEHAVHRRGRSALRGHVLHGGRHAADAGHRCDDSQGDPAMSMMVTPEQFRKNYTFLAPADYHENFADVLIPQGAAVTLDGKALTGTPTKIGNSEWGFVRAKLAPEGGGVHKISTTDDRGLGLQVAGFGFATSFYYPGGLNLKHISEPPIVDIK